MAVAARELRPPLVGLPVGLPLRERVGIRSPMCRSLGRFKKPVALATVTTQSAIIHVGKIEIKRLLKDKPCSDFIISAVSMDICERAGGRLAKKWCDPPGDSIPAKPGSTSPRVGDVC